MVLRSHKKCTRDGAVSASLTIGVLAATLGWMLPAVADTKDVTVKEHAGMGTACELFISTPNLLRPHAPFACHAELSKSDTR